MRFAFLLLLLSGCSRDDQPVILGGHTMGTTWSLRVDGEANAISQKEIQQPLDAWETLISHWRPDSAISRFNASTSTDWIAVPAELVEVVELAQQIGGDTDHALDITLGPLIELWGFGASGRRDSPPTDAEIVSAKAECGWQHLHTRSDPPALRKDISGLHINVSAVAEGWALDHLAQRLKAAGATRFLLEIGGEVHAHGEWRVGIQTPAAPPGEAAQTLLLKNQSIATSGTYRQHFAAAGRDYAHLLDPRTGRPVEHRLASVSVIHSSAAQADGFATALLVMGPDAGRQLAERLGLQVVWFEREK
ncbi:FAD:protein FMN transferase [Prosthecobacter sp.]|uniref:FAD:protein FMN transferase n=1 Tax=Prosthecobacter sp. TaxID=1965333 RepID=UPI002487F458|nr:FAD:protein FMN transferase [Prosthecobacter sp.]MDI1313329.1 FAD:protein FMN transferase [Prosthecobacter sp.]